ncbi:MAG TPA: glycosyltransferase family 2 protein [Acidimicrobiales bacterium]|jgi:cellulose synthase/poly-beta-1,6-N-acetylglucosamine synthase-like glycosyltransferase|nr:glycosyltransferase family 2 protein [Acidimicrobiales bacterium]
MTLAVRRTEQNRPPARAERAQEDEFRPRGAPWTLLASAGVVTMAGGLLGLRNTVLATTLTLQAVFIVYFLRHLAFVLAAFWLQSHDTELESLDDTELPAITVLVACRNEEAVLDDLLPALRELDYPSDRLQTIIVDDASTDSTGSRLDQATEVEPILVIHRPPGSRGGKSGALNAAVASVTGDVIVVFDADHRPRTDVLRRLARHFVDPRVGAVQGRCVIRNGDEGPLARVIEIDYLSGYLVNEYGRQALFGLPAYGGANCAVRTSTLRALGGWNEQSVTEDTDLTLRVLLSGQRVHYDVTAVDDEEAVTTIRRFWRQRYRWARGHQQVWRDFRRPVWQSRRISLLQKLETTMFLLVFHIPVASAIGLALLPVWIVTAVSLGTPIDRYAFALWTVLFLGPLLELGGGLLLGNADRRRALALFYFFPVFLLSIAVGTKAWLDGVLGKPYAWVKTQRSADRLVPIDDDPTTATMVGGQA